MRAMRHGVPMVVIPGLAGDQPFVAVAIQEWGAGRALSGDAGTDAMRAAAQDVLSTPSFRNTAKKNPRCWPASTAPQTPPMKLKRCLLRRRENRFRERRIT
jgi:UDP:flavonoid glycosyltransferase YjiC (YdhE family)